MRILVVVITASDPRAAKRVPAASRRVAALVAQRASQQAARMLEDEGKGRGAKDALEQISSSEIGLISRFLEAKVRYSNSESDELSYNDYVILFLQAWFRARPWP